MSETPTLTAWTKEQAIHDETEFTPDAEPHWLAWNGQSPEVHVVEFVCHLVGMMRPALIVETGVGQGYMTRAITAIIDSSQKLLAYESNDNWRQTMWSLPFWQDNRFIATLSGDPTPADVIVAEADLCVFDSDFEYRFTEVEMWHYIAKPGAVCLIHDTADRPDTIHQSLRDFITGLGMTGVFLKNPRGSFMAVQGKEEK